MFQPIDGRRFFEQEMKARVTQGRATLILAECGIPTALAEAFRTGQLSLDRDANGDSRL